MMKLEAVGLRGCETHAVRTLGWDGAPRRAGACYCPEPDLIMFDEPFVGQDPITMGVLVKLISELNSALGVTCVVVSHDVPEVLSIADYAYIVADKRSSPTAARRRCRRMAIRACGSSGRTVSQMGRCLSAIRRATIMTIYWE